MSQTPSDNGHFIGFDPAIYRWLISRKKARGLRSIPATVVEIVRQVWLEEQEQAKVAGAT